MIAIGVFAAGTLVFTVTALSIAPQVVMFVALTHATFGLDHVRPGGDRDPAAQDGAVRPGSVGSPVRCCSASSARSSASSAR